MGDHRPTITCDFEMHGHKAHYDFGWCNWSDNGDGIDQRIVDWFREQAAIAIGKWQAEIYEADRERREKKAGFLYGFDPAYGEDNACRVKYERLSDGTLRMIETQYWNKEKECWE